ncbi:hypothetical protein [Herbaspirillum sp.]|uniref:hypothetical protein n=1 Tax=Herbaspirillum sp. TaxID=1890675 RepID=UPI0031D7EDF5
MERKDLRKLVSKIENYWGPVIGNKVLYDLCKNNPRHEGVDEIHAKIWLIGRSYAASIERRKINDGAGDFYNKVVIPQIKKSGIDDWIDTARRYKTINQESMQTILEVHGKVTKLFHDISKMGKRSLASKYLHFHGPNLFFIFDSITQNGLREFIDITGRSVKNQWIENLHIDPTYGKFATKCLKLRDYIYSEFGVSLSLRQMDALLLDAGKRRRSK